MHTQGMGTERCRCLHQSGGFHLFIPTSGFKTGHTTGELLGSAGRQAAFDQPVAACGSRRRFLATQGNTETTAPGLGRWPAPRLLFMLHLVKTPGIY